MDALYVIRIKSIGLWLISRFAAVKQDFSELRNILYSKRHRFFIPSDSQRTIISQGNIVQTVLLQSLYDKSEYVIANTHLSVHQPILVYQSRLAMEFYQEFVKKFLFRLQIFCVYPDPFLLHLS